MFNGANQLKEPNSARIFKKSSQKPFHANFSLIGQLSVHLHYSANERKSE